MAEVVLFHHALGLTPGLVSFAGELRQSGHTVHTPDLYQGRTFSSLEQGVAHVKEVGFAELLDRALRAVEELPAELVYAGFSLGVMPAQKFAQTRAGARGALLFDACVARSEFGTSWPPAVAVQIHAKENDPEFDNGWDLPAAREIAAEAADGELFLYPGDQHLFADSSLPWYDPEAAELLTRRVLDFLGAR